ncbi:MAG: GatB/YqeY domain-containing protein [Pseudomonadota bacterium]
MPESQMRDDIKAATITAMKAGEKERTATLRQISAKIKDRDIEMRTSNKEVPDDELVTSVLQKMAKQRRESITMYVDGGREELAAKEQAELAIIEEFLPQMMSENETKAAVDAIKAELGADSMKDMGRVMGELKKRHGALLDGGMASGLVKSALS